MDGSYWATAWEFGRLAIEALELLALATIVVVMLAARKDRRSARAELEAFRRSIVSLYVMGLVFEKNLKTYFFNTTGVEWKKMEPAVAEKIAQEMLSKQ